MVAIQGVEFPEDRFYDVENQIWYTPLPDGTIRTGFTPFAVSLMGEVLVFTPKRLGRDFESDRYFAMVEGGKWVGAARAAFDGVVVAHNEDLIDRPSLLMRDAYGEGWMLVVRATHDNWRDALVTGEAIAPAMERWFDSGVYKERDG